HAVGLIEFAMLQAVIEVPEIVLAVVVWLLNAAACGRVIARNGEAYGRPIGQLSLLLHKSLAERPAPDDRAPVIVLNGPGHDLACRCRSLVNQHHNAHLLQVALARGEAL